MSGNEDSFIVIEETPSMLQYSILDSISSNCAIEQDTTQHSKSVIGDETNTTLFASALSQSNQDVDVMSNIDKCVENLSIQSVELMQSNVTNVSANTQKSSECYGHHVPMSKNTLAHSFLLGDIDCDIMKVREERVHFCMSTFCPNLILLCSVFFSFHHAELFAIDG